MWTIDHFVEPRPSRKTPYHHLLLQPDDVKKQRAIPSSTPNYIYIVIYIVLYILFYTYIGWVGVGWQRHCCKTCRSLRELDTQGTYRFLAARGAVAAAGGRVRPFVRGVEKPLLRTRGVIGSRSVDGEAPTRQVT